MTHHMTSYVVTMIKNDTIITKITSCQLVQEINDWKRRRELRIVAVIKKEVDYLVT